MKPLQFFIAFICGGIAAGLVRYLLNFVLERLRPNIKTIIAILFFIVTFWGISFVLTEENSFVDDAKRAIGKFIPAFRESEILTNELILQLLYGNDIKIQTTFDGKDTYALRQISAIEAQIYDLDRRSPEAREVYSKIAARAPMFDDSYEHVMVIIETAPPNNNCHACSVALSGAIISRIDERWTVQEAKEGIISVGEWGEMPPISWLNVGPNVKGAWLEAEYSSMGYIIRRVHLITNTQYPGITEVFSTTSFESNVYSFYSGECSEEVRCFENSIEISFHNGQSSYYDIHVYRHGTALQNGTVVSIDEMNIYRFTGSQYELQN